MAGIVNETLFGANVDFRGVSPVQPTVLLDGDLLIGSTALPNIRVGNLTSLDSSVTITNGSGTIDLSVSTAPGTVLSIDIDANTPPGTDPVVPTVGGDLGLFGAQVASGTTNNVIRTNSTSANNIRIEVQRSTTAAASNQNLNGVAHFNSSQFSVDSGGFVSLAGGGAAIDEVGVDAATGPGTNPVLPNVNGRVTVTGAQVATGGVGTNVIRTNSLAANTYTIEIQRTTTAASTNVALNGVSHFNSANFTVDSNGFVSRTGQPIPWNVVSVNTSMLVNNGYIAISPGGALTFSLPSTSAVGDMIELVLDGATSWQITQPNAASRIRFGNSQTTLGTGGSITTTQQGDSIRIVCQTANARWNVLSSVGNLTLV